MVSIIIYNHMEPLSYMQSVVDGIVMRRMTVVDTTEFLSVQ